MLTMIFKKSILAALTLAMVAAAVPFTSAFAQTGTPPTSTDKLERAWARQTKLYRRIGKAFDSTDAFVARIQALLDKASANGKDVSALQAALNAFSAALTSARPAYEGAKSLVDEHAGFDSNGKVSDAAQAQTTVAALREKMQEIKSKMNGTGKALRDAIKAFRQANKPPATPAAAP